MQVIQNATKRASNNKIMKDIKDFHRALMAAITVATNTTDRTNHKEQVQINNKTTRYPQARENSTTSTTNCTSSPHPGPTITATTSTTSRSTVSAHFTQRPNVETETPEHKTLNNALATTNEVVNRICKYSVNHAPSHTSHRNSPG